MKRIFIVILISSLFASCIDLGEEIVEPVDPIFLDNCSIEVDVRSCLMFNCSDPIDIENKRVEIYPSINDATQGTNLIAEEPTNQNGWVKFYDYNCGTDYYIKVDLGENGIYLGQARFFASTSKHVVSIIKNYFYDYQEWARPIVLHVSLEFMTVGQWSRYNYFETDELSYDATGHYTGSALYVGVNNQLDSTTFVIGEDLTNANPIYFPDLSNSNNQFYTESVWRFENDTLFVSNPNPIDNIISFIWNITEKEGSVNAEYAIPLKVESDNFLDMNEEFFIPDPIWTDIGSCSDFTYEAYLFEDLMVEFRDYTFMQNELQIKALIYNNKDGLVRNLTFSQGQPATSGFDLVVD